MWNIGGARRTARQESQWCIKIPLFRSTGIPSDAAPADPIAGKEGMAMSGPETLTIVSVYNSPRRLVGDASSVGRPLNDPVRSCQKLRAAFRKRETPIPLTGHAKRVTLYA